jgi:hypothetical protein
MVSRRIAETRKPATTTTSRDLDADGPNRHNFTESVCAPGLSACGLHGGRSKIQPMDVVSILLGILMFAILLAIIEGIDRI